MTELNGERSFRDKMNEWRGYVLRALEDIDSDLKRLFTYYEKCEKERKATEEDFEKEMSILKKRIDSIYLKVVGVAVAVGSLAGFLFDLAKDVIMKMVGGG